MQRLKILVAVMTLLLVAGIGLLAYGVARVKTAAPKDTAALTLPASARVEHMAEVGDNIALYVKAKDGEFIYFFDPATGNARGRLAVNREK